MIGMRTIAPVPEKPTMRCLAVGLQLCGGEGAERLVLLLSVAPAGPRGEAEGPLADKGWDPLESFAIASNHLQVISQAHTLPLLSEAMIQVQVEAHVGVPHEAVVIAVPDPPYFVQTLSSVNRQDYGDLIWRHARAANRIDSLVVETAELLGRDSLARLVAHGDSRNAVASPESLGDFSQDLDGTLHVPVLPTPGGAPVPTAGLVSTLSPRCSVEVQEDL